MDSSKCSKCEKSFSRNRDIEMHIKTVHEGVKDIQCTKCKKCFAQKSNMKQHQKICQNVSPHKNETSYNVTEKKIKTEIDDLITSELEIEEELYKAIKSDTVEQEEEIINELLTSDIDIKEEFNY